MAYGFNEDKSKIEVETISTHTLNDPIIIPVSSEHPYTTWWNAIVDYTFPSDGYFYIGSGGQMTNRITIPTSEQLRFDNSSFPLYSLCTERTGQTSTSPPDPLYSFIRFLLFVKKGMVFHGKFGQYKYDPVDIELFKFYPITLG